MTTLAAVWDIDPVIFSIGNFEMRYYSLCWILAFVSSYFVLYPIFRREGHKPETLTRLSVYVILGTMIGARLGHCLFYEPAYYLAHPLEMILPIARDPESGKIVFQGYAGLASHGAAIGIIISLWLFCRKSKMKIWDVCDKLGLVAPLGGACIRLGNFFNSEIIGGPTSMPWGIVFGSVDSLPRHPAQLYEAGAYILIFLLLYYLYRRRRERHARGFIFGLCLALIFAARFLIEYTKEVQELFEIAMRQNYGMDMGQMLSLPFVIGGVAIMIWKWKPGNKKSVHQE